MKASYRMGRFLLLTVLLGLLNPVHSQEHKNAKAEAVVNYFKKLAADGKKVEYPPLVLGLQTEVGDVGFLDSNRMVDIGGGYQTSYWFKITQILSKDTALIHVKTFSQGPNDTAESYSERQIGPYVLKGDFASKADGAEIDLDGTFTISGVHKYTNVTGSSTTALIIEPTKLVDLPDFPEALLRDPRTWSDRTGKFTRQGKYLKYDDGKVLIELDDQKRVNVELAVLDSESQEYVRKQIKAEKAKTTKSRR